MNKSRPSRSRQTPSSSPAPRHFSGKAATSKKPSGKPAQQKHQQKAKPKAQEQRHPGQRQQSQRHRSTARPAAQAHPRPENRAPQPPSGGPKLHWREALGPLLAETHYQPLDERSLARRLHVPQEETRAFADFLVAEQAVGRVMTAKGGFVAPKRLGLCVGILQMNERGFGFLVPTDPSEPDFYVSGEDTANALHGDLVVARLKPQRGARESRLRGEVVKLLKRKRTQLVGTLRKAPGFYFVHPDEVRIPYDIRVPTPRGTPPVGQKVVVELGDWPNRQDVPHGTITEVLGAADAPGVDLLSIIRKHDLPTSFPEAVEQEAADIPARIPPAELARREDFRKIFTLTIDPDDAKDFDDALSFRQHPNGDFEIFVHIADVSHYVHSGSPLDIEARGRGNSVYLVDRVIPMLPEKLSNGICSLQPNVDRLVKTAVVTLSSSGEIKHFRFAEGVIHSTKRFSYQEAFNLLGQPPSTPLGHDLHSLNSMAQLLRHRRFVKGALDLEMPEVKVRVNELGIPTRLEKMENDISHQLIEEFMLLANEVVALELKRRGRPGLYRIHENPDPFRLAEYRAQVKSMGFACGDLTQRGEIQKLLTRVHGQAGEGVVKIGLLKSLKRATYSPKPLGHFGLSKINYTHFTSPIRRYSDLVVHRVLFSRPGESLDFNYDGLSRLALHLSTTERTASEAEQESVKLKKLEYFEQQSRSGDRASFQALILEVRASGLMVQIPEFLVQGLVPLSGSSFVFNAQRLELHDRKANLTFRAGQSLQVEVASVDLTRNQVDFRLIPASGSKTQLTGRH